MTLLKNSNYSFIHKILVISLSNLGDIILTFPVIDILKKNFPSAKISIVVSSKGEGLVKGNPCFDRVYVFNKQATFWVKLRWILKLRKEKFDLTVDLRNTAIPFLISSRWQTPLSSNKVKNIHMKTKHLMRLKSVYDFSSESSDRCGLFIFEADRQYVDERMKGYITQNERFAVISPGAADRKKRWSEEGFVQVANGLAEVYGLKIVFVGDKKDRDIAQNIMKAMRSAALNLCGETSLTQLAEVLSRALVVIANDSAVMHMASYLDKPTLALFGPTDPKKYGPWSSNSCVIKEEIFCAACRDSHGTHKHVCMKAIRPDTILKTIRVLPEGISFIKT